MSNPPKLAAGASASALHVHPIVSACVRARQGAVKKIFAIIAIYLLTVFAIIANIVFIEAQRIRRTAR